MNTHPCDCNACERGACGCCEGAGPLTPADTTNRPGLSCLRYRAGTHGQFLETMKARLPAMEAGGDGQTPETFRPLQGLTTREGSDPSIAMLDAWATVGDVLSFYQERIANENYLRTATERRSIVELARLVGYRPRPGVAASAFLAYTIDANQTAPLTIPAGSAAQSVPAPGEQPQTFETSEDVVARPQWNNLQVRLRQPQNIDTSNVLVRNTLHVAGVSTNLRPGDKLLFVFDEEGSEAVVRTVASIDTQFPDPRTAIALQPVNPGLLACEKPLAVFIQQVKKRGSWGDYPPEQSTVLTIAEKIRNDILLGGPIMAERQDVYDWVSSQMSDIENNSEHPIHDLVDELLNAINLDPPNNTQTATNPSKFIKPLLKPSVVQARDSLSLQRNLARAFAVPAKSLSTENVPPAPEPNLARAMAAGAQPSNQPLTHFTDAGTQLLIRSIPHLAQSYYAAWAGAQLNPTPAPLKAVYALRSRASLFGAMAAQEQIDTASGTPKPNGTASNTPLWKEWQYADDEEDTNAFLDGANETITPGSYAVTEVDGSTRVLRIKQAATSPRSAYGLTGQATKLTFYEKWRTASNKLQITDLRKTKLYVQSEPLTLTDVPVEGDVTGQTLELDGLYQELTSGRWVIVSGERTDIDQVHGVMATELQMISGLRHGYDPDLPDDSVHTTLELATPLAYAYKRQTLKIHGNVVKATQGGTRREILGSGNGAQVLQSFTLNQPPVTFVAAPTADGAASTLHVYADNVEWHESDSLAFLDPKARGFVTRTGDDGSTTVTFGDGAHGARLPSGVQNITAVYRSGLGAGGNVKAGQITMLQSRPLGVTAVINPLRASGGADRESRDLARGNVPISVMPLDRLVSVQDYEDFARRFAGIAKARARRDTDGRRGLIYLTIAGAGDVPIDTTSDLYRNLADAFKTLGDPGMPLRIDPRERKALVLSANIKVLPDYQWECVASDVRAALLDAFGFDKRQLGQRALLSEAIGVMQRVRGVAWVDVDAFGAVPERVSRPAPGDATGAPSRELLTPDEIVEAIAQITAPAPGQMPPDIDAWSGGFDPAEQMLRPAEIIAFTLSVSDTLILNQIP